MEQDTSAWTRTAVAGVIFLTSVIGAHAARRLERSPESVLSIANCFGGGVFLAAGFIHLLADAVEDDGDGVNSAAAATGGTDTFLSFDTDCLNTELQSLLTPQAPSDNASPRIADPGSNCSLQAVVDAVHRLQDAAHASSTAAGDDQIDDEPYPWIFFSAALGALATLCIEQAVQALLRCYTARHRLSGWSQLSDQSSDGVGDDGTVGGKRRGLSPPPVVDVEARAPAGSLPGHRLHSKNRSHDRGRTHGHHGHSHGFTALAAAAAAGTRAHHDRDDNAASSMVGDKATASAATSDKARGGTSGYTGSIVLLLALSVHSFLAGLALGVEEDIWATFLAIITHKGIETFALATALTRSGMSTLRFLVMTMVFALVTPSGIVAGLLLRHSEPDAASGSDPAWVAHVVAFSSGMFVFIGFVPVILSASASATSIFLTVTVTAPRLAVPCRAVPRRAGLYLCALGWWRYWGMNFRTTETARTGPL